MFKYILSLFLIIYTGCGGSSSGESDINPFNIRNFDPYEEPYFKFAWHLQRVSPDIAKQRNIKSDSNINIYEAWQRTRGAGVKVAVIDYDFNPEQEDIKENVVATYNVDKKNTKVYKGISSHGTACASIIASAKNGIGTLGVAPEAKLILIDADIQNKNNESDDASKIKAFYKAKELGAKVISCSWGTLHASFSIMDTLRELHNDGIVIVFASGNNDGMDLDSSPSIVDESELDSVIGVGATTQANLKAEYSNYGDNIDILAPGGDENDGLISAGYENKQYYYFNGTSAAAPVIAGVVALMLSANPDLTPDEVREILISSAYKIDGYNANYDKYGFSHTYAYGKVNASAAVDLAYHY